MFTVNRNDIFIAIPIEDLESGIEIELGHDLTPYLTIKIPGKIYDEIHLTNTQIDDMIDSLKEIKTRIGGKKCGECIRTLF